MQRQRILQKDVVTRGAEGQTTLQANMYATCLTNVSRRLHILRVLARGDIEY
jgi:hypothetical protein